MVDIKGLDKARVLKALYDRGNIQGTGRFAKNDTTVTVEICKAMVERSYRFDNMFGLSLNVDLDGDEFDESGYDRIYGAGAAQRAVDSIRAEKQDGGDGAKDADTAKDTDGEKKELTMEEKTKLTKEAMKKILNILTELPPDVSVATSVLLKTVLPGPGPMGGIAGLMMGGLLTPPTGGLFGGPFPFKGRFG